MEESGTFEMSRQSGLRRKPRGKRNKTVQVPFLWRIGPEAEQNHAPPCPYIWWLPAPIGTKKEHSEAEQISAPRRTIFSK